MACSPLTFEGRRSRGPDFSCFDDDDVTIEYNKYNNYNKYLPPRRRY